MNKTDLVKTLAVKENLTEKMATEIVNLIFNGLAETGRQNRSQRFREYSCKGI